jgi:hypothetical protein
MPELRNEIEISLLTDVYSLRGSRPEEGRSGPGPQTHGPGCHYQVVANARAEREHRPMVGCRRDQTSPTNRLLVADVARSDVRVRPLAVDRLEER